MRQKSHYTDVSSEEIGSAVARRPLCSHGVLSARHARRADLRGARREIVNQANKPSRSFAVLLEALNRHRGNGQQKVTVEHVTVDAGSQAIVGVVTTPGARRRDGEQT
jgi:hypothetical protein